MALGRSSRKWFIGILWMASISLTFFYASNYKGQIQEYSPNNKLAVNRGIQEYNYHGDQCGLDPNRPLIFIGGMPRSGTTLMRTMLDAHPEIRCGQETRVIPRMLFMRNNWIRSPKERQRLTEAGILPKVLDKAMMQFILEIIVNHGHPAKFLCNKDPFTLKATVYLHELFPNAKFILMLRDGRATAHSIITRKVTIAGFDITSYRDVLTKWNQAIDAIYQQCAQVGTEYCLMVYYEQLVLQPVSETKRIFNFLNIPWNENVLHHEQHMGEISLSKMEKSTDQVIRPLYLDGLNSWVGHIPEDVASDLPNIAPMLAKLGYDPYDPNPKYGEPDAFIKSLLFVALSFYQAVFDISDCEATKLDRFLIKIRQLSIRYAAISKYKAATGDVGS